MNTHPKAPSMEAAKRLHREEAELLEAALDYALAVHAIGEDADASYLVACADAVQRARYDTIHTLITEHLETDE